MSPNANGDRNAAAPGAIGLPAKSRFVRWFGQELAWVAPPFVRSPARTASPNTRPRQPRRGATGASSFLASLDVQLHKNGLAVETWI